VQNQDQYGLRSQYTLQYLHVLLKVLSVFSKFILSCDAAEDWNEPMARYVVDILLDHYTEVLQVPSTVTDHINSVLREKTHLSQVVGVLMF